MSCANVVLSVLGGDTFCFELAARAPTTSAEGFAESCARDESIGLGLMHAVASGPSKWRKTFNIDPSPEHQQQQLLLAVSPQFDQNAHGFAAHTRNRYNTADVPTST